MVKEDVSLPKAAVQRLISQSLPPATKYSAGEITQAVGSLTKGQISAGFIKLLSSKANEICEREGKKTLTNAHFLEALQALGFACCLPEVHRAVGDFEQTKQSRAPKLTTTKSVEELEEEQKKLFAEAEQKFTEHKADVVVAQDTDDYDKV